MSSDDNTASSEKEDKGAKQDQAPVPIAHSEAQLDSHDSCDKVCAVCSQATLLHQTCEVSHSASMHVPRELLQFTA